MEFISNSKATFGDEAAVNLDLQTREVPAHRDHLLILTPEFRLSSSHDEEAKTQKETDMLDWSRTHYGVLLQWNQNKYICKKCSTTITYAFTL